MTSLHPHWRSTEDERPVPVRAAPRMGDDTPLSAPRQTVSRRPAAVVGMLLAVGVGMFAMGGYSLLRGQAAGDVIVRITAQGFVPAVITVKPGDTITWSNEDSIPHLLSSATARTVTGPLDTPPIYPGTTYSDTIDPTATKQTHQYGAKTAADMTGQIVIDSDKTMAAPTTTPTVPPMQVPSFRPLQPSAAASSSPSDALPSAPSGEQGASPSAALPTNPYTVGSAGKPGNRPQQAPLAATLHPGANTKTGPELWVSVGLSLAFLWFATRKAFRRA